MSHAIDFGIDDSVTATFPGVHVMGLRVCIPSQATLHAAVAEMTERVEAARSDLEAADPITSLEEIARWRSAYGKLGVKPSKYPSSIEALLRRARKGQMASIGIPAVDLYNAVSVIHRVPLGAYDGAKLGSEKILLRLANPELDRFVPLGGHPDAFPLNPALVVYAQGPDVLCWGFNTRDCERCAVDAASSDIVFFTETSGTEGVDEAASALRDLSKAIAGAGGTTGELVTYSAKNPEGPIQPAD